MANLFDPEFDPPSGRKGFSYRRARLGRQAGSQRLGTSLYEVPPGQATFPYHWHSANEELLIVLDGRPSLRTPTGWRELAEGEVVALPIGESGAHQVLNRSDATVRFLVVSEMNAPEMSLYPDTNKIGIFGRPPGAPDDPDAIFEVFRRGHATDYWEGEEPPATSEAPVKVERLGVVGAGTMGAGVAQLGCLGGFQTALYDPDPQALATGADRLQAALAKGAGRGLWSAGEAAEASGRLSTTSDLAELAGSDLVIEAAPEDLELKRDLFAALAAACGAEAILATNTSSLPVSEIAAGVEHPERVCGMHFFNPPPLMRLVEIVAGESTDELTLAAAASVARAMDREPVRAKDSPGFIVNRCNRPFALEALRMLGDGFATHAEIDCVVRERGGYRMGPFELMDLVGIDVGLEVARSFFRQRAEPRWEPHPIQEEMVAAGRLGRKSGTGFYEYRDGRRVDPDADPDREPADPGAILERIVAQLVNEATFAAEEGVASPPDIDTAMRLGLNHPRGPFEWQNELGAERLVAVLEDLAATTGQPERYRIAPGLAAAGQASTGG